MDVFEKSQTVDPEVRAHVYSLVSAIGGAGVGDGSYLLGDDALACLKDIGRWIRLYDDKVNRHDVKRCLAEANLVQGDLLEILAQWREGGKSSVLKGKVALQCLDLLQRLTWPMEMDEEKATINIHRHLPYLQLAQVEYKRAILHHDTAQILRTAIRVAIPAISTPKSERVVKDEQIIGVVLHFLRNITRITQPPGLPAQGDEDETSRSATITAFHDQDVLQLILTIASSIADDYPLQDVVILEILFQLLKGTDPKDLFKERKELDSDKTKAFKALLVKEKAMLASYNKNAPTRHHRFGTMIWVNRPDGKTSTLSGQNVIFDEQKTLNKMDQSKAWNKPKTRVRSKETPNENNDFAIVTHLDDKARKYLRAFVEDFLDSSFNPLFNGLRRAIGSESERVQGMHTSQYYYLTSWFLEAERARQEALQKKRNTVPSKGSNSDPSGDTPYAYIAAVMTQENFVLLSRKIQQSLDDKAWSDLHACMRAFTQILLTVSAMSESPSDDDQEIAENILSRIFYEEATHDQIIRILREYKEQGFGYLDSCTELAHVFIRMLERYSKQNVDLQIRSKRRARRKKKVAAQTQGEDDGEGANAASEAEDEINAHRASSERKFDFNRYAVKFMTEPCINTFVRFSSYYADLNTEQLKRAHRFFYRCAFKMERAILLFRVDILHLFNRMIKGPHGLSKENETFKDWEELVKQVFRRCMKKLEDRREMMIEMLFMKIPATLFYLENGYDMEITKSKPRPPAEVVVKPGMTREEEIGVAVSVLVNQGKLDALAWVKTILSSAIEERKSWDDEQTARNSIEKPVSNPSEGEEAHSTPAAEEPLVYPSILLKPDTPERRTSLFKDKFLRLLLVLLSFERIGAPDDTDATWLIPSPLTAASLQTDLTLIKGFEFDLPVYNDGQTSAESLLRSKNTTTRAPRPQPSDDEGNSDIDEAFVPSGPTPRPRDAAAGPAKPKRRLRRADEDISDEERQRRADERTRRDREKDAKVKSALRVTDSDDEEDGDKDAEFFRLEEARRGKMKGLIRYALLHDMDTETAAADQEERSKGGRKRKSEGRAKAKPMKKRRTTVAESSEDEDEDADGDVDMAEETILISSRESSSQPDSDGTDGEEDGVEGTSQSSRLVAEKDTVAVPFVQTSGSKVVASNAVSDDEDDFVVAKPARRNVVRAPFIVESDSE